MKQKNVILMVVAVGCGLVAAFLTTQINAKPKVEQVEVVVALKDLPVGTVIELLEGSATVRPHAEWHRLEFVSVLDYELPAPLPETRRADRIGALR